MKADVQMISGELVVSGVSSSSSLLLSNMITSNLHLNNCYFTTNFFFFGGGGGKLFSSSCVKAKEATFKCVAFFSWKVLKKLYFTSDERINSKR